MIRSRDASRAAIVRGDRRRARQAPLPSRDVLGFSDPAINVSRRMQGRSLKTRLEVGREERRRQYFGRSILRACRS